VGLEAGREVEVAKEMAMEAEAEETEAGKMTGAQKP
jgi:hypothetical protein